MRIDYLKRRAYLGTLVGGIGALAGCPTTDSSPDDRDNTAGSSQSPTDAETPSGEPTTQESNETTETTQTPTDEPADATFEVGSVSIAEESATVGEPIEITTRVTKIGGAAGTSG